MQRIPHPGISVRLRGKKKKKEGKERLRTLERDSFFGADLGRLACVCLWKGLGVQATGMSGRRPQFTVSGAALSNSRPALPAHCLVHFTSICRLPAGFSRS